ncbi:MAG: hypothetical protein ABL886_04655 [Rhodoglobus sp.]
MDPDPLAQRACAATAAANGVGDRLSQLVRLDAEGLGALLAASAARALAVVDCEGYEDELLDPVRAPALARTDLLVETHDFARAGVTARLTERLATTHDVRRLEVTARDPGTFPELASVTADLRAGLVDEFRHHPQSWLACTARASRP